MADISLNSAAWRCAFAFGRIKYSLWGQFGLINMIRTPRRLDLVPTFLWRQFFDMMLMLKFEGLERHEYAAAERESKSLRSQEGVLIFYSSAKFSQ